MMITSTPIITLYMPLMFTVIASINTARKPMKHTTPPMRFTKRYVEPFRTKERIVNTVSTINNEIISWLVVNEIFILNSEFVSLMAKYTYPMKASIPSTHKTVIILLFLVNATMFSSDSISKMCLIQFM